MSACSFRRFRWTPTLLKAFSLMAVLGLAGCQKEEKTTAEGPPEPKVDGETVVFAPNAAQLASIAVQTTKARTLAITHVTGRLYWNDDTTVRIFTPVFGRVARVLADVGDAVVVGTPLAELNSPDYAQALANARSAVGNLMAADKAFIRIKGLLAHGYYAQKDVDAAEAAYIAALAERDRSKAVLLDYGGGDKVFSELERAGGNDHPEANAANYAGKEDSTDSHYVVHSPLNGILVDKTINPGQEIRPDFQLASFQPVTNPLFVVSDPTTLWLQVDVAESDIPSLQQGLALRVTCEAYPGKVFDGTIAKIQDTLDPATRTVKVRGVVNNPDKLLKAEMYVLVDVVQDVAKMPQAGVEVPAKALFMKGEDSYLFIEQSPGSYQRRQVKVGIEKDNIVPVFEGVTAGQKVVTEGALLLQALVEPAS
jgi:cobalt-zinc-cadmium efflux system membrane fusion protein